MIPFRVAVSRDTVLDETAAVLTENVPDVDPAGIVSEAGTVTDLDELANLRTNPPFGAAPFKVTVPEAEAPPFTVVGLTLIVPRPSGFTLA